MNNGNQTDEDESFAISRSTTFDEWLGNANGSIAFTSYQSGRFFLIGSDDGGSAKAQELRFARSMGIGLSHDSRQIFLATQHQIYRFDNFLAAGQTHPDGSDGMFIPRLTWTTGDLDAHDIGAGPGGRPIFVNTAFNCLATVSAGYSFRPIWKPEWVTEMVAEDRCHLNGMAIKDGQPLFVTAVAQTNTRGGWREERGDGGVVIDVQSNRVVCEGLSMPHSPRLYRNRLWVLNSGKGEFGFVDLQSGKFNPVCFCPGYARGLTFVGHFAVIGLSLAREGGVFGGLDLDAALVDRNATARCGLIVVDLRSGQVIANMSITGSVRELYDVQFIPEIRKPRAVGFRTDEIRRNIAIDDRPLSS